MVWVQLLFLHIVRALFVNNRAHEKLNEGIANKRLTQTQDCFLWINLGQGGTIE
jgi:hypothetical protein